MDEKKKEIHRIQLDFTNLMYSVHQQLSVLSYEIITALLYRWNMPYIVYPKVGSVVFLIVFVYIIQKFLLDEIK